MGDITAPVHESKVSGGDCYDQCTVDSSLKKIAKGTGLVLVGTIFTVFIGFFVRVIIVRNLTQADYGIFSLTLAIFLMATSLTAFGLPSAITRYIAKYQGQNKPELVKGTIVSGLHLLVFMGVLGGIVLFVTSNIFAYIFNAPEIAFLLKLWAVALPVSIVSIALVGCFRGFGDVKPQVMFQTILFRVAEILLLIALIYLVGATTKNAVLAYVLAYITAGSAVIYYSYKNLKRKLVRGKIRLFRKKLVRFAYPLVILGAISLIMSWTDVFMIGLYLPPSKVGLYNGAVPLARYLNIVLSAAAILYLPISSYLIGQHKLKDLKRVYQVITKWTVALTLPLFCVLIFFPKIILRFLFGAEYLGAAIPLQVLSLGFFFHVALGLNTHTMIALGKQKLVCYCTLAAAIVNVVLNLFLIPILGISGAAIATCVTYVTVNSLISLTLYRETKVHPFTIQYVKPVVLSLVVMFCMWYLTSTVLTVTWWMLPLLLALFLGVYGVVLLVTRSFDHEDIAMLNTVEKRLGVNLRRIKNIVKRYGNNN